MSYKRVLVKLSGEALAAPAPYGISQQGLSHYTQEIEKVHQAGVEIAIVIGGGNLWRGKQASSLGIDQTQAHYMGMLATLMNGIALRSSLSQAGISTVLLSKLPMGTVCETYHPAQAIHYLTQKKVVIIAGGLGIAHFSTDTAAAAAALALKADLLLKGSTVDGIYPTDPVGTSGIKPYKKLSYQEIYEKKLHVMDMTSITLAQEHHLPIIVYKARTPGHLSRIIQGEALGTLVCAE